MHLAAVHLAPILAAEKSKTAFYIAGGVLVGWALILSLAIGMRRPAFPGDLVGQRAVAAVSIVLVFATIATAVITASPPAKAGGQPAPAAGVPGASSAPSSSLALEANPHGQLSFDLKQLNAKAGTVTIAFHNVSPLEHNLTVTQGSKRLGATPTFTGGTRTLRLTLEPGSYTFYCSVLGHRLGGMEGTIKVS